VNYLGYIVLFSTVILSGISVFAIPIRKQYYLKLLLAFSGSFILSICFLHLIPEIYQSTHHARVGIFILIGFFIQVILEFFSEGVEHGHIHTHKDNANIHVHGHHFYSIPFAMIVALYLHSFLEGMPLHGHLLLNNENSINNSLLLGIVLHNIPVSVVFMSMLLNAHMSKSKAFLFLLVFAIMTPLGTLFGNTPFLLNLLSYEKLMALVVGIFLHISTTILFEFAENHLFNLFKLLTMLLGVLLALFIA
jgi:zinc transporter ZupT